MARSNSNDAAPRVLTFSIKKSDLPRQLILNAFKAKKIETTKRIIATILFLSSNTLAPVLLTPGPEEALLLVQEKNKQAEIRAIIHIFISKVVSCLKLVEADERHKE